MQMVELVSDIHETSGDLWRDIVKALLRTRLAAFCLHSPGTHCNGLYSHNAVIFPLL